MLIRDFLQSLRWLRARPWFAVSVIAILALGVGANTTVFSIVDATLLRSLPFESSPGLVRVVASSVKRANIALSAADYLAFSGREDLFRKTAPLVRDSVTLTGAGEPDQFFALRDAGALFPLLGVHARLGRALADSDDQPNAPALAVLSDRLWQRHFHSDPAVVGRTITVSGDLFTIAGVMPPEFDFPAPEIEMWLSGHLTADSPGAVQAAARLTPGISAGQAQAALEPVAQRLEQQHPKDKAGLHLDVTPWSDALPRQNRLTLLFIMAAVGLVLLIACADVGGLLLSRAVEREREIAIRASLGAGLWQVTRQLLAEGLLLAGLGGLAGVGLARGLLQILSKQLAGLPVSLPHLQRMALNGRALAFSAAVCCLLACLCSLAPVLFAFKVDLQTALRGHSSRQRASNRLFSTLIAAEAGFAFLLLAGSGLMLRSLIRVEETDHGFRPEHVLTLRVPVGTMAVGSAKGKYDTKPRQIAYYHDILERLQRVPGVIAAAYVNNIPLSGATTSLAMDTGILTDERSVSSQYFTAMGIPLLEGRLFSDNDDGIVINQFLARQLFPDRDPVGQKFGRGPTILGVVKDATQTHYDDPVKGEIYASYQKIMFGAFLSTFVVRTSGDPLAMADTLRKAIWSVDPDQPVLKIETMDDVVADSIWRPRFSAWIFSVLGGFALVLACAGVYSVIAYTARLRAREVGIRVALGATPSRVIATIVRDALRPLLIGLAASAVAAVLLSRLLAGLLYETAATDPVAYCSAAVLLLAAGVAAALRPAISASTADPVRALRTD